MSDSQAIQSTMIETRRFPPPREFAASASISSLQEYNRLYKRSIDDPEAFWSEVAANHHWFKPFDKVLEWERPLAKWFVGGKTNVSYNCLDL